MVFKIFMKEMPSSRAWVSLRCLKRICSFLLHLGDLFFLLLAGSGPRVKCWRIDLSPPLNVLLIPNNPIDVKKRGSGETNFFSSFLRLAVSSVWTPGFILPPSWAFIPIPMELWVFFQFFQVTYGFYLNTFFFSLSCWRAGRFLLPSLHVGGTHVSLLSPWLLPWTPEMLLPL